MEDLEDGVGAPMRDLFLRKLLVRMTYLLTDRML